MNVSRCHVEAVPNTYIVVVADGKFHTTYGHFPWRFCCGFLMCLEIVPCHSRRGSRHCFRRGSLCVHSYALDIQEPEGIRRSWIHCRTGTGIDHLLILYAHDMSICIISLAKFDLNMIHGLLLISRICFVVFS